ncbi:hypothetical protein Q4491_08310 [Photobacterium sp. 2_MG-2023]|uniref:hypothetical protein n=1 Tax=Photobacterium sp. 2_MG-2023 TaxID=3062663 RepID=UPI0026E46178|nr:hypothetical protein [Photobacterium sp. 2_MG-2023]MDO6581348.1 hypothetical protein [Photobacterium sp. 2_MG-2023]
MNSANINLSLSDSCFVPFIAFRLTKAKVVWVNMSLLHKYQLFSGKQLPDKEVVDWLLDEFAYTTFSDSSCVDQSRQGQFYAERYGGQAINRNGGGARAGLKGHFQVKGMGPNALVGEGSDFWYSHGSATLVDMIQEALWGEVCHHLLPYGSVRCLAVIQTGLDAIGDHKKEQVKLPGGMVVRENALRIAHFERAPFFSPSARAEELVSDCDRTKAALESLKYSIEQILATHIASLSDGLIALVERWAVQFAYAKSVRLMHGAVTSSNLCLDGRWIDFGTISTLGKHANTICGRGNPPFWHDHSAIYVSIYNLCFYINKLGPVGERGADSDAISQHFTCHFERAMEQYFIALVGIPLRYIELVTGCKAAREFYMYLLRMLQMGGLEPRTKIPAHQDQVTYYSYTDILALLDGTKMCRSRLEKCLRFSFDALMTKVEAMTGLDITSERQVLLQQRESNLDPLHFDLLRGEIFRIAGSTDLQQEVSELIDSRVQLACKMRLR